MKRKNNGLIVGTILVVLVGALIFIQFLNQEPVEKPQASAPLPTAPPEGSAGKGPQVKDILDNPTEKQGPVLEPR
jgi:hypothetical protein